jgi:hypothetical protein
MCYVDPDANESGATQLQSRARMPRWQATRRGDSDIDGRASPWRPSSHVVVWTHWHRFIRELQLGRQGQDELMEGRRMYGEEARGDL